MKFKGNLHVHTTNSDGLISPLECISKYKENGYDFLAVTDHFKFFDDAIKYSDDTFTVLNGCELNYDSKLPNKSHHIVCIEPQKPDVPDRGLTPNEATKMITDNKGICILAHPSWSLMDFSDVLRLKNIIGIEIWNHVSYAYSRRGDSSIYIDVCAANGLRPLIFAADDSHFYDTDCFGGYIVVESPSIANEDLLNSIKKGDFYSSQGPEIHRFERVGDKILAETSKVKGIAFFSDSLWAKDRYQTDGAGANITKAEYEIKENDTFVRMECYDQSGKTAWSQIIDLR